MHPLVSVIVPNFNHEKYLQQRLDSIFNQTYPNFEVILLDDCSTDNSRQLLLKYAHFSSKVSHCIFNDKNSGNTFKQWQKGILLSKGDLIWIAESDDFCSQDFLENVIKPLIKDQNISLSYCQSNRVDKNSEITGSWKSHVNSLNINQFKNDFDLDGNIFIEKYLIYKNVIPNASAVVMRKSEIIKTGFCDNEMLKYCGDWQLYFQILINKKVGFIAKTLNNFRYHSDSVIANALKFENRNEIISTDFQMRNEMVKYLKMRRPVNFYAIVSNNKNIIKNLKYERVFILIKNKQKIEGFLVLMNIFWFFIRKYSFKKNLKA